MNTKKCPYCFEEIMAEAILCKHCKSDLSVAPATPVAPTEPSAPVTGSFQDTLASPATKPADKRILELVLGLLGGVFGIGAAVITLFFGGIDAAFSDSGTSELGNLGFSALLFSIVGIVGAILVIRNGKIGGLFMTIAAVGGFISVSLAFILPGILLIIPGIMSLRKPIQADKVIRWKVWIPISIGLFILILVIAFSGGEASYNTELEAEDLTLEKVKYKVGDTIPVGDLTYEVLSLDATKSVGDEYDSETAAGTYLKMRVKVTNRDNEERTIDSSMFTLLDEQAKQYEPDDGAMLTANDNTEFFLTSLNPGLTEEGLLLFDVPDSNKQYFLKLSAGMIDSEFELVNIKYIAPVEEEPVQEEEASFPNLIGTYSSNPTLLINKQDDEMIEGYVVSFTDQFISSYMKFSANIRNLKLEGITYMDDTPTSCVGNFYLTDDGPKITAPVGCESGDFYYRDLDAAVDQELIKRIENIENAN